MKNWRVGNFNSIERENAIRNERYRKSFGKEPFKVLSSY